MEDARGRGSGSSAAEELILRTVAAHAHSLLRTARKHSLCPDDAQDAYQRALEIFMRHAERLDAARAAGWLHVVVKREAQAIRRARQDLVASDEVDLDQHEARALPTPEERAIAFDMVHRSAEALKRLKPQELRALWLKAEGHSYSEIGAITGWSYTKVNRCLVEGRRAFLKRYEGIETGVECARWLPVISAIADGEATPEQVIESRPHLRNCPGCRATLRTLRESSDTITAVLPVPLVVVAGGAGDHVSNLLVRAYETIVTGLTERTAGYAVKVQGIVEASVSGKVAVVAASAAAVAGGGYATVEHPGSTGQPRSVKEMPVRAEPRGPTTSSGRTPAPPTVDGGRRTVIRTVPRNTTEFRTIDKARLRNHSPEFGGRDRADTTGAYLRLRDSQDRAKVATEPRTAAARPETPRARSPEFGSSGSPEFGP